MTPSLLVAWPKTLDEKETFLYYLGAAAVTCEHVQKGEEEKKITSAEVRRFRILWRS